MNKNLIFLQGSVNFSDQKLLVSERQEAIRKLADEIIADGWNQDRVKRVTAFDEKCFDGLSSEKNNWAPRPFCFLAVVRVF